MAAALALGERGAGRTGTNPAVGCFIVRDGRVLARGWTQPSGRPHAEAMALEALYASGESAKDTTIYVTLEPCAHKSSRGPSCADLIVNAAPARVVIAAEDPDPRTAGKGAAALHNAGIIVEMGVLQEEARAAHAGFFYRAQQGRPLVTLKMAMSLDGQIALADGRSKWITGAAARAHTHLQRARHDAILVGGGTLRADNPALDVRLPGLESRAPERYLLSSGSPPDGWQAISSPGEIISLPHNRLMVEGGAQTAAAFLRHDLIDRLLLYRAPILMGESRTSIADIGLDDLADARDKWSLVDKRQLGDDRMELYERRARD